MDKNHHYILYEDARKSGLFVPLNIDKIDRMIDVAS